MVDSKIVALRLNSDTIRCQEREKRVVKDKLPTAPGKKRVGLIELFSAERGTVPGRNSTDEVTCFINNIGLGIQFAAIGSAIYNEARARGLGKEIPTDWFLESVHP